MTDLLHGVDGLDVLIKRFKRDHTDSHERRQDWRLMFEKLYLEYKDSDMNRTPVSERRRSSDESSSLQDKALDIEQQLADFEEELSDYQMITAEGGRAHDLQTPAQAAILNSPDSKSILNSTGSSVFSLESRLNNVLNRQIHVPQSSKPLPINSSDKVGDWEKSTVRILKSDDGFHLIVRDNDVTKESMQKLFVRVKNILARYNAKLSAVIVNGEKLWESGEKGKHDEWVDKINFDEKY